MEFEGILKDWNDERGFGFIESNQGGQKIFAHIKSFNIVGRPEVNKVYRFEIETNEQGKKRAVNIKTVKRSNDKLAKDLKIRQGSRRNKKTTAQWGTATLFIIPLFILIYLACLIFLKVPEHAFLVYIVSSAISFGIYFIDKSAAEAGRRRIPEANLHMFALFSGWPGALIAQQVFRHKSVKKEFRQIFWMTVIFNIAGLITVSALPLVR